MKPLNPKFTDWRDKHVWLIGASSGIGAELAAQLRQRGAQVALSARRVDALHAVSKPADLVIPVDVTDDVAMGEAQSKVLQAWSHIDLVIYCAGTYKPMRSWAIDLPETRNIFGINLYGVYHLLHHLVPHYLSRGAGGVCIISSVAGYTGLPKAVAYGPSKAALINLAQTVYTDLHPKGIGVYLVNPGFVATRLTDQNDFKMPALVTTQQAAESILSGLAKGHFEIHFPKRFSWFMKCLSRLPDRLRFSLIAKTGEA